MIERLGLLVLFVGAMASVCFGVWQMHKPAAFIVGGSLLLIELSKWVKVERPQVQTMDGTE